MTSKLLLYGAGAVVVAAVVFLAYSALTTGGVPFMAGPVVPTSTYSGSSSSTLVSPPATTTSTAPTSPQPAPPLPPPHPVPVTPRPGNGVPYILSMSPEKGPAGTVVTLRGQNLTVGLPSIYFRGYYTPFTSETTGTAANGNIDVVTFTAPSSEGACPNDPRHPVPPGNACPMYEILLQSGTYSVNIVNNFGTSNSIDFELIGSGGFSQ